MWQWEGVEREKKLERVLHLLSHLHKSTGRHKVGEQVAMATDEWPPRRVTHIPQTSSISCTHTHTHTGEGYSACSGWTFWLLINTGWKQFISRLFLILFLIFIIFLTLSSLFSIFLCISLYVQSPFTSDVTHSCTHLGMVVTYHFILQVIDMLVHCYHWPSGGLRIIFAM